VPKIPGTFAAVERYALVRDRVAGGIDPDVAEDSVRHACLLPEEPWTGVYRKVADATELVIAEKGHAQLAACGHWVRVDLPQSFDSSDPRVCGRCMEAIGVKNRNPVDRRQAGDI
jgi:hypothetical protein